MAILLDQWQIKFRETKGDKILCSGRQIGKSVICAQDAAEWAFQNPNLDILMVAPTERQAYALFNKTLRYIVAQNPKIIKKGKERPTQQRISLTNGVNIWCLPVGPAGLGVRFLTIGRLYIEEAARIPDEVIDALTPMLLTSGGDTILLSTPKGTEGYFADVFTNKDEAYNSFTRFSMDTETVVRNRPISESWPEWRRTKSLQHLEREKARMTNIRYEQEYMGRITDKLHQFFSTELIKRCMILQRSGFQASGVMQPPPAAAPGDMFLGVDIARMGEDESTFISVARISRKYVQMVDMEVTTKTLLTETIEKIRQLNQKYNYRQIYIDTTGLGSGVFDVLLQDEQCRRKVVSIENAKRALDRDETRHRKLMKEDLYVNLLKLMQAGQIQLFDDLRLSMSLKSVQYEIDDRTKDIKIFGHYTHLAEALVRAAHCMKDKTLNIWIA